MAEEGRMNTDLVSARAPYTRVDPQVKALRKIHDGISLSNPITSAQLERIGINHYNAYQVMQGLEFLGLIDAKGKQTPIYERLRRATTAEYKPVLAESVKAAYQPVFSLVDPTTDNLVAINDAFKNYYEPAGQRERMVALFTGLCREAGILPEEQPKRRRSTVRKTSTQRANKPTVRSRSETPQAVEQEIPELQAQRLEAQSSSSDTAASLAPEPGEGTTRLDFEDANPDYRMLYQMVYGLFNGLPRNGRWTKAARDKWVNAYNAMTSSLISTVDWLVEVIEE
jgi:hypothetical protein